MAERAQLHLITDRRRCRGDLAAVVHRALAGVDWVQVREKTTPAAELYRLVTALAPACRAARVGLLVNDRVDVALAAGADGVHLATKSLPVAAARRLLGHGQLVGCSVHSLEEAADAARAGADYVTFGNVFATASHPGFPPKGLDMLQTVVEGVGVPVVAVGGITPDNLADVLGTGCAGIAVIGAILEAPDPAAAALAFRQVLERAPRRIAAPRGHARHADADSEAAR